MESSGQQFKDALKSSYTDALGNATPGSTGELMKDLTKYSKEMKEDKKKILAKHQFAKDLQDDPDFEEFKKRAKYGDRGYSFGIPNVSISDPYIKKRKWSRPGKEETTEATGSGSSGAFAGPVAFMDSDFVKRSFAETPGVKKETKESTRRHVKTPINVKITKLKKAKNDEGVEFKIGDKAKTIDTKENITIVDIYKREGKIWAQYKDGRDVEEILIDGLEPIKGKLKEQVDGGVEKVEATEATGSGSVGGYSTPSMWAKSTTKKDWGPSRKTQYKGGAFVKVKDKCTKFPYCNQGDINALKITKNESVKEAIKNVSKNMNISEEIIKSILEKIGRAHV